MKIPIGQHFTGKDNSEWIVYARETTDDGVILSAVCESEPRKYYDGFDEDVLIEKSGRGEIKLTKIGTYHTGIRIRKNSLVVEIPKFVREGLKYLK